MDHQTSLVRRWRGRRSTVLSRIVWFLAFLLGFLVAGWLVRDWLGAHQQVRDNFRPAYYVVLAGLYWAVPIAAWGLIYPGDGRRAWSPPPVAVDAVPADTAA